MEYAEYIKEIDDSERQNIPVIPQGIVHKTMIKNKKENKEHKS